MGERRRALSAVLGDATLRRVTAAFAAFSITEYATWIAMLVFAFGRGGVSEAGVVSVVQLLPAVLVSPFASFAGDRFRRDLVLLAGYAGQAVALALTSVAMASDAPGPVVYGAGALVATAISFTRPIMGALLPAVTTTPATLTAANVIVGIIEQLGMFAGPLLAAVLLAAGSPASVFAVGAGLAVVAAISVAALRADPERLHAERELDVDDVVQGVLRGFETLRRQRSLRLVILVATVAAVMIGACDVLFVAVAGDILDGPDRDAGLLNAAFGLGAVVGAATSVVLVGRRRLSPFIAGAAIGLGLPMLAIAASSLLALDLLLFALIGGAGSLLRVATLTMIQRVAPRHVLARVFGIVEGLNLGAQAVGAAVVAALAAWLGVRGSLVALGLMAPLMVLARLRGLLRIDARAPAADPGLIARLRHEPIFAPLGPPALEALAVATVDVERPAGAVIVKQGDRGSWFYLLEAGRVAVTIDDRPRRELDAPSSFGEIALMRGVPRTATVTASTPVRLHALHRDDFLEAVTGHPDSLDAAEERTNRLLDP